MVENHHNFAWREHHNGRDLWVVRKGATPAFPGQRGFVGGSMGDMSVIIEGVENADAVHSLYSTVHGAGRVMSRTQAAGKVRRRKRWACSTRDCDRLFESADATCPEHPGSRMLKTWIQEQIKPGVVDWPAVQARLHDQDIVLVGGGADEAPEVYKRLPEVLAAHGDLDAFRTIQRQPAWRGRDEAAQLRRFLGAGYQRKLRYARLLTEAVSLDRVPRPLAALLTAV